jgi:hypothetical protein
MRFYFWNLFSKEDNGRRVKEFKDLIHDGEILPTH